MNCGVVSEDGRLVRIDLGLDFADAFLKLGELVLQGLDDLLGHFLLLLEFLSAANRLTTPVLVLLAHGVDVVGHKVDGLTERVRALT